jgi:CHAT domain-containing protein
MAEAFIYAGAVGVVAPLWSLMDGEATELAVRFYDELFRGRAPADILSDARAELGSDFTETTALAFRFFGHPSLNLQP